MERAVSVVVSTARFGTEHLVPQESHRGSCFDVVVVTFALLGFLVPSLTLSLLLQALEAPVHVSSVTC